MGPLVSSYAALFFVSIGTITAWIMLEVHGRPGQRENIHIRKRVHKVLGYGFVLIYLVICVFMVRKAGYYPAALSARVATHIALSLFLAPALGLKLLIARRYKRLFSYLPVLGSLIVAVSFTLSGLAAGYYFLHRKDPSATIRRVAEDISPGKPAGLNLVSMKCSKCHDLKRVYRIRKDRAWWKKTIDKMIENSEEIGEPDFLSESEAATIITFLAGRKQ